MRKQIADMLWYIKNNFDCWIPRAICETVISSQDSWTLSDLISISNETGIPPEKISIYGTSYEDYDRYPVHEVTIAELVNQSDELYYDEIVFQLLEFCGVSRFDRDEYLKYLELKNKFENA